MPARDAGSARVTILEAAQSLLGEHGARGITVEAVARQAGCAKGLVHYHYKTKRGLLEAVARHVAEERERRWLAALSSSGPRTAIDRSWRLLTEESGSGFLRAWLSLFQTDSILPGQTVSEVVSHFCLTLGDGASGMMERAELRLRIPKAEIGWLLGSVVNGIGWQLLSGADASAAEGAYAAAWLGILSLTGGESS